MPREYRFWNALFFPFLTSLKGKDLEDLCLLALDESFLVTRGRLCEGEVGTSAESSYGVCLGTHSGGSLGIPGMARSGHSSVAVLHSDGHCGSSFNPTSSLPSEKGPGMARSPQVPGSSPREQGLTDTQG